MAAWFARKWTLLPHISQSLKPCLMEIQFFQNNSAPYRGNSTKIDTFPNSHMQYTCLKPGVNMLKFEQDIEVFVFSQLATQTVCINNFRKYYDRNLPRLTFIQVNLYTVCAKFDADRTKNLGGVRKSRFCIFKFVEKKLSWRKWAWPIQK